MRAFLIGLVLLVVGLAAAAETPVLFVVIVNAENPADAASRSTISSMFLKRIGKWESGIKSQPVDLVGSSKIRETFSRHILSRLTCEVEQLWQAAIFSGRAIPPPKKVTEAEVVAFVAQHAGAIGYVSAATPLDARVKVLQVDGE